jgi:tryptophanyl-tRNA synthetase
MRKLLADPEHIDAILRDGSQRARVIASDVMKSVKTIVGFIQ